MKEESTRRIFWMEPFMLSLNKKSMTSQTSIYKDRGKEKAVANFKQKSGILYLREHNNSSNFELDCQWDRIKKPLRRWYELLPGLKQLKSPETRHWSSVWIILAAHFIQFILYDQENTFWSSQKLSQLMLLVCLTRLSWGFVDILLNE